MPSALRPASWSKIRAVKHHLKQYDWVFWVDADTLITNSSKKVESLLPEQDQPDLILTRDPAGFNAGEPVCWALPSTWLMPVPLLWVGSRVDGGVDGGDGERGERVSLGLPVNIATAATPAKR